MLWKCGGLRGALFTVACLWALVANAATPHVQAVDIPGGDLIQALETLAKQSGVQLLYRPEQLHGLHTHGAHGKLSSVEAVRELLIGTQLTVRPDPSGVLLISPATVPKDTAPAGEGKARGSSRSRERLRPSGPTGITQSPPGRQRAVPSTTPELVQLSDVVITGTRLEEVPKNGPEELRSYSHEQIEASGQPSITGFLNTLPEVSQNSSEAFNQGATNSVQLRGFPVGSTLVLLDGHHAPASGFGSGDSFDINNIPEGLLERVDILPLGSSAIYGSDALAGVVNFVLNRHLDGLSVSSSYGGASHYADRSATATAGRTLSRGDFGVGVSYENHGALLVQDRPFLASGDFSRFAAQGGQDLRSPFCQPGTVFALSGNLPGVGAPFAAIPAGLTGRPSISDFAGTANTQNLCNAQADLPFISETKRWSALGYGDLDITDHVHVYATILSGELKHSVPFNASIVSPIVPASNAFNPFGVPVLVFEDLPAQETDHDTTQFQHLELGLRGDLPAGWTFDVNANSTEDRDRIANSGVIFFPNLNVALASSDPATAINLFSANPGPALSSVLRNLTSHFGDRSQVAEIVFRGPLFRLPGGPLQMAIGASYARQRFTSELVAAFDPDGNLFGQTAFGSRRIASTFAELRAPLLASFQGADRPALALSGAVRRDQFSDFGVATTPQIGIEFRPWESLLLRATSSKAFRAPTLYALDRSMQVIPVFITDPRHGGADVLVPETLGGNPGLRPETGHSSSIGLIWNPKHQEAATIALTYWKISEHNRVTTPDPQALVDNESEFSGRVVRDAAGDLVSLDTTFINFGDIRAEGVDFDASDSVDTRFGELSPSLSLTLTDKFQAAFQPGSPLEDRLGKPVFGDVWAPRLKANAALGWRRGPLSAAVTARYLGHYLDYQVFGPNSNRLGGYALWDATASVALGELLSLSTPGLRHAQISITAVNVFNRGPQYSNSGIGYDPQEYDILGRFVTARLRFRW